MNNFKPVLAGVAALFLTMNSSNAQDTSDQSNSWLQHFYISAAGGGSFVPDQRFWRTSTTYWDFNFNNGGAVQGAVGVELPHNIRAEVEGTYRTNKLDDWYFSSTSGNRNGRGKLNVATYMANLIYEYDVGQGYFLFGGAGLGVAHLDVNFYDGATFVTAQGTDDRFAYQFIAGAGFEINERVKFFTKYTYLNTDGDEMTAYNSGPGDRQVSFSYDSHAVFAGFTFYLD